MERFPCPEDGRATNARLTATGRHPVEEAALGHVEHVRRNVIDALTPQQVGQLTEIADAVLARVDPAGAMRPMVQRYDATGPEPAGTP